MIRTIHYGLYVDGWNSGEWYHLETTNPVSAPNTVSLTMHGMAWDRWVEVVLFFNLGGGLGRVVMRLVRAIIIIIIIKIAGGGAFHGKCLRANLTGQQGSLCT